MKIELFTIGFGRPDLLWHQKRLLDAYLGDEYGFCVVDNTPEGVNRWEMQRVCQETGIGYLTAPSPGHKHDEALNFAASHVTQEGYDFFGFLDHDVFPRRHTSLIDRVRRVGFFGVGQAHPATGHHYLWPGFCFFSREWLGGRQLDFSGIRGDVKMNDGDTGSMNWPLFEDQDWRNLHGIEHGYVALRKPDDMGLQSWGYEILGDWIHLMNASHWMEIEEPQERDRLALEVVAAL